MRPSACGPYPIEQALEIGLALEPEALGRLSAPLAQSLPPAGGEGLPGGGAEQCPPGAGFFPGDPLRLPQQVGWQRHCDRFGGAHPTVPVTRRRWQGGYEAARWEVERAAKRRRKTAPLGWSHPLGLG